LGERLLPEAPPPPPPCAWGTLDTGWAAIPNAWGLDLPGLHAKLLPQWGLSGKDEELVREGLQAAPPLDELFEQISRLSWQDNAGNYPRISELFQRWNGVYAEAGIPLRMTAAAQRQTLAWMTWHIEARGEVQLGDRSVAVQWTGRLDPLNVADPVPSLLDGQTDVVVPLEDVRDARVYDLWGRLDPARKDPLAKPLRAEFEAQLGSEATEVLLRTAPLRSELDAVRVAVAGRSRCSGFGIMRPAWWGVTGDTDARMADVAVSSGRCAPLTTGELARLRKATGALGTESGLADAMTLLVAHVSRAVSIEGAALRLACPDDCAWSAKAPVAKAVGLMDSATRVTAAAHWCDPASWPPSLRANADGLDPCGGADLRTAAAERWPAQWGSARIEVRGLPVRALARWPRDPG
jgi:hypothetical protein